MNLSVAKKTTAFAAAAAIAGFSSVVLCAAPASAAPPSCGTGTLIAGNICEQTFITPGTAVFTPSVNMTKLQVLLVAGGGSGNEGYGPGGGGGGEVKVVDFSSDASTALNLVVGGAGEDSSVTEGVATPVVAVAGGDAALDSSEPGSSGNGNPGFADWSTAEHGGGGGAGASPPTGGNGYDGGAGVVVSDIAASGSVFSTDANCYGGGGAAGDETTNGAATCGGGSVSSGPVLVAPTPNSGGGAGSYSEVDAVAQGASGLVVVRWIPTVTLSFTSDGHGATVAPEQVPYGSAPTQPADPTADGFVFKGWYTNAALTTKADFSTPITASTTFFASWDPALAVTGGTLNPLAAPLGAAGLSIGLALIFVGRRRARRAI